MHSILESNLRRLRRCGTESMVLLKNLKIEVLAAMQKMMLVITFAVTRIRFSGFIFDTATPQRGQAA